MNTRRNVLGRLALSVLTAPRSGFAQQRPRRAPRIGYLTARPLDPWLAVFRQGLRPAIYTVSEWTELGGLLSYGTSFPRAAAFADKILKGARPADLPVEQPTKFELVVNLRTAKSPGITVSPTLLLRADRVVE